MAKLPSGWIFIPRFTDLTHIKLEERKLVTCKECENAECEGRNGMIVCGLDGTAHKPEWFCADGEALENAAD